MCRVPHVPILRHGISQLFSFSSFVRHSRREWVKIAQDEILGHQPIKLLRPGGAQRNLLTHPIAPRHPPDRIDVLQQVSVLGFDSACSDGKHMF